MPVGGHPLDGNQMTLPKSEAQDNALAFERLLERHGILIKHGSNLERVILDVFALTYGLNERTKNSGDFAKSLAGFGDLARLVLGVEGHPSFPALLPHLRLLNHGEVLQTSKSLATDQVANKLFELYIGCLAMRCGHSVLLDNPLHSAGDNPDIIATFDDVRWGIACKVLHGNHQQSILNLLDSGLQQIERSSASTGVVIINLKNRIDHDYYWPTTVFSMDGQAQVPAFASIQEPLAGLVYDTKAIGRSLLDHASHKEIKSLFQGRKSIAAFVFWAQTTAMVVQDNLTFITCPHVLNVQVFGALSPQQQRVLECFESILGEN